MKYKTTIILFFIFLNTYAHKNRYFSTNFGNVKIIYTTGYFTEEANKAILIAEYASELAKQLQYKDTITLYFRQSYAINNHINKGYFITKKNKKIFIKLTDSTYNPKSILKLINYSISNNTNQKTDYQPLLKKLTDTGLIKQILSVRKERPTMIQSLKTENNMISYFFENNKFHFYYLDDSLIETPIISVSDTYQFELLEYNFAFFSNEKDVFYFFSINKTVNILKHKIKLNKYAIFNKYEIKNLGNNIFALSLLHKNGSSEERVFIYYRNKDKLVNVTNLKAITK